MEIDTSTDSDRIIVYGIFDMAIDGNLAKTKLDAYGIPCFLTNENLANLYPLNVIPSFGVRLMIFENDKGRVKEILEDQTESSSSCPFCKSNDIYTTTTGTSLSRLATIIGGLTFGFLFPQKRVFLCRACEHEFDSPENF